MALPFIGRRESANSGYRLIQGAVTFLQLTLVIFMNSINKSNGEVAAWWELVAPHFNVKISMSPVDLAHVTRDLRCERIR